MAFSAVELALLDHVHQLNAGNEDTRAAKGFEPEHRAHNAFDRSVVLLHDVVEVSALAQFDVRAGVGLDAQDGSGVGAALVDGDFLGHTVQADGLFEKASRSCVISLGAKQKIDRIFVAIDGSVQVLALASDPDLGLIHSPARANGALSPSEHGGHHRQDLHRPAMDGRVINDNATFGHHLLNVPQAQRIGRVPAHAGKHHFQRVVHALDHLIQGFDHRRGLGFHVAEEYRVPLLRQNP
jgi:hypothetical protein